MQRNDLVGLASQIAEKAHHGQKRWNGEPYFEHCCRVAQRVRDVGGTPQQIAAAYLHDTVEDTGTTLADLTNGGVPFDVVCLIEVLTRDPYESYEPYIDRVAQYDEAVIIKLADLEDNLRDLDKAKRPDLYFRYTAAGIRLKKGQA